MLCVGYIVFACEKKHWPERLWKRAAEFNHDTTDEAITDVRLKAVIELS